MSAANLGVCVGPSLLWSSCPNVGDDLRVVPAIVECLITHCEFLCGSHIPSLLGDLRDSGTEESDCKFVVYVLIYLCIYVCLCGDLYVYVFICIHV